jgi:hypothetical protein
MAMLATGEDMKILVAIFALTSVLFPAYLSANDGFGSLGVGGIVLSKTDVIAINKEILDISCDRIQVWYEFVNESDEDQQALVMFPLPRYPAFPSESGVISHGQPSGFKVRVNGKTVNYRTEVKATLKEQDVTDILKSAGLSEKQIAHFPFDKDLLDIEGRLKISLSQIEALTKKGLVDGGFPLWDINVTYVWTQRFPARSTTHIDHTYRPFISGGTAGGYSGRDQELHNITKEWGWKDVFDSCPTEEQLHRLDRLLSNKSRLDGYCQVPGTTVEYILTTANTWKDGIRDFKLRIHTKSQDEIVALCFPSKIRKVSDLLYETRVRNFKPKAELSVYFGNVRSCRSTDFGQPPKAE